MVDRRRALDGHGDSRRHRRDRSSSRATTSSCAPGYYSYKGGYTPEFPGIENFDGQVVHPQAWPDDLDYAGKQVVVIGSGATAVTLVPAMADDAEHVTMLQRSPTYVVSRPDEDAIANTLRKVLPDGVAYDITRLKNTTLQQVIYKRMRTQPETVEGAAAQDGAQGARRRLRRRHPLHADATTRGTSGCASCRTAICSTRSGRARRRSSPTTIDTFTATGIALASGDELEADIIVTATGLQLVTLGEMDFVVDGEPVDFSKTWTYKGFAYSDVPNLASSFGYINASWTLRADLICEYVCRLLNHMDETGTVQCTPRLRASDADMPERDWIENFSSGYMQRVMHLFPKQGDREPWINPQNYRRDKKMFKKSPVADGVMRFARARVAERAEPVAASAS